MAIIFNPNKKIFTLQTAHTTYQMQVDRLGYLLHLYYGAKSTCDMDYVLTYADRGFSGNPYAAGMNRTYSRLVSLVFKAKCLSVAPTLFDWIPRTMAPASFPVTNGSSE